MKQTKRLTRNQRKFLEKKKVDIFDVRIIEDTKQYLKYQDSSGEIHIIEGVKSGR